VAAGDGRGEERQRDRESRAQFEFGERITDSEESSEEGLLGLRSPPSSCHGLELIIAHLKSWITNFL
jgi:hypothetical protein